MGDGIGDNTTLGEEVDEDMGWENFPAITPIPIPTAKIATTTTTQSAKLDFGFWGGKTTSGV